MRKNDTIRKENKFRQSALLNREAILACSPEWEIVYRFVFASCPVPGFGGILLLDLCGIVMHNLRGRVLSDVDSYAVLFHLGGRSGGLLDLHVRVMPSSDVNV